MNLRKRCMCHGWESVSCLLYRVGVRPLVRAIYLASRARWTAVSGDGQEDQKVTAPPSVRVYSHLGTNIANVWQKDVHTSQVRTLLPVKNVTSVIACGHNFYAVTSKFFLRL